MIDRGLLNYPEQLAVRLSKMERDIKRNAGKSANCSGGGIPGPKGDPGPAGQDANVVNIYSTSTTDAYSAGYVNGIIPTVNDGTLTIQKNGTDVQTFTANQSTNATANITVPTSFSDLTGTIGTNQIDDAAVTPAKTSFQTYSTTPQEIGTWIDGNTIYRKVVTGTTANAATTDVNPGLPSGCVILNVYGMLYTSSTAQPIPRVMTDNLGTYGIGFGDMTNTRIFMQHSASAYRSRPYFLVIEYKLS